MKERPREVKVEIGAFTDDPETFLRSVNSDNELVVSDHGTPLWRVVTYVDQTATGWDAMMARGEIRPARNSGNFTAPSTKLPDGVTSESILDELRGDH